MKPPAKLHLHASGVFQPPLGSNGKNSNIIASISGLFDAMEMPRNVTLMQICQIIRLAELLDATLLFTSVIDASFHVMRVIVHSNSLHNHTTSIYVPFHQ
jgi:hypothetical protein